MHEAHFGGLCNASEYNTLESSNKGDSKSNHRAHLLQQVSEPSPTMRQSELLLKYQFICNCRRCCALPQTYVDHALQETFFTHIRNNSPRSLTNLDMETAVERLRDVFDGTIMEYMEVGNPVSCCEKIEGLLFQFNPHLEQTRGVSHTHLRLSPLHHLSLNGYTTLHSTYKIRSGFKSIDGERFNSFDMSRISAAYSLLLAGATHHLFLYECSLIVSSATFLVNAGESLLHLARSSSWNLFPKCMSQNLSSIFNLKCPRCLLMDKFGSDFSPSQTRNREFDDICREFLTCLSIIIPKVWSFLVQGCLYLEDIKDPTDFSWLGDMRRTDTWDFNPMKCADKEPADDMRTNIFQLGIHCLMYGGYLSCICYGDNQYRTRKMIQC